ACQAKPPPAGAAKNNWVSLAFRPDVALVSGSDVCTHASQMTDHYVCYRDNGSRYVGTPTAGVADNVNTRPALAPMRVLVGYDRVLFDRFTAGARLGFAFGGATTEGASFFPIHVEVRGAYYFLKDPFREIGVRPFVFVSGGLEQVDSKVDVEVLEDGKA